MPVEISQPAHQQFSWLTEDGLRLFAQRWLPMEHPKAIIAYVHGFKDHSDRFAPWARQLTSNGYGVVAFDLRGHGRSDGKRGHAAGFMSYIKDVGILTRYTRKNFPGIPMVLYGHSLGGNIVTNYLISSGLLPDAAVVTSPWFRLATNPSVFARIGARLLKYTLPGVLVRSDLDINGLSRDPEVAKAYAADPLVHNRISPKLFFDIEEYGEKASRSIYKINIPLLVMHGSADRITSCRQTREFVQNSGGRTTYREWPGAMHELHNDICREEVFQFLTDWLNRQFK